VVPELKDRLFKHCKEVEVSTIDLNGRAWLRAPGFWFERGALPDKDYRYALEPRNIFVGKSERIVRALLFDRYKIWTQAELVKRTGASSGLVSRIVQHLVSLDFVEKIDARHLQLKDVSGLLDAWAQADSLPDRASRIRCSGLSSDPWEWTKAIRDWANREEIQIAFTQWIAAVERYPYTEPVVCSAYVSRLPRPAELESLGLREVSDAGNVWLYLPDDEGVFIETQPSDDLSLVSDAQIYLDLQNTGLRGPEAAKALRHWEGFCRS
jgi:hypothetical protein